MKSEIILHTYDFGLSCRSWLRSLVTRRKTGIFTCRIRAETKGFTQPISIELQADELLQVLKPLYGRFDRFRRLLVWGNSQIPLGQTKNETVHRGFRSGFQKNKGPASISLSLVREWCISSRNKRRKGELENLIQESIRYQAKPGPEIHVYRTLRWHHEQIRAPVISKEECSQSKMPTEDLYPPLIWISPSWARLGSAHWTRHSLCCFLCCPNYLTRSQHRIQPSMNRIFKHLQQTAHIKLRSPKLFINRFRLLVYTDKSNNDREQNRSQLRY